MLYINLNYTLASDTFALVTNVADDKIVEVLSDYVRSQMGLGPDTLIANECPVYSISLGINLENDSFHVSANTGNDSLTLGIVMKYLRVNNK